MHFIFNIILKGVKVFLTISFIIFILIFINSKTNNSIINFVNEKEISFVESFGDCYLKNDLIHNGVLYLNEISFEKGFGSCFKGKKLKNVDIVYIKDVYGGNVTEARILANKIKEYNISVVVDGTCNSACVDVVLHSPNKIITMNGSLGVHKYKMKIDKNFVFKDELTVLKHKAMLKNYEDLDVNIDFITEKMNEYESDEIYFITSEEMRDNNLIDEFISYIDLKELEDGSIEPLQPSFNYPFLN